MVTALVASSLLVGPIYSLYFVKEPLHRLALIQAFTTVFALCAGFISNARPTEILTATATWVASPQSKSPYSGSKLTNARLLDTPRCW